MIPFFRKTCKNGTMYNIKILFLFLTCFCSYECSEGQINTIEDSTTTINVLFIGNSLTYSNDLPNLVKTKAAQKGITIEIKMIAKPNYAIIDHWNDGEIQEEIATKKYDFVIIQQGPSSQPYGREVLIEYGEKYSELCKNNDAKLCYFMVWPSVTYYQTFEGVIKNYSDAASINNAILCPVGEVWKEHFDATNNFDYYGPDGFHPSLKGSEIAADVIVRYLFL